MVSGTTIIIVKPNWIVAKGERMNDCSSTTSALATTVLANQLLGQLKPKGFDIIEGA